jgi:hypothetical protein
MTLALTSAIGRVVAHEDVLSSRRRVGNAQGNAAHFGSLQALAKNGCLGEGREVDGATPAPSSN